MAGAGSYFQKAIDIQNQLVPKNDSSLANLYGHLGMVTSELGRNAEAESLLLRAVAAAEYSSRL